MDSPDFFLPRAREKQHHHLTENFSCNPDPIEIAWGLFMLSVNVAPHPEFPLRLIETTCLLQNLLDVIEPITWQVGGKLKFSAQVASRA